MAVNTLSAGLASARLPSGACILRARGPVVGVALLLTALLEPVEAVGHYPSCSPLFSPGLTGPGPPSWPTTGRA
jgi:hypothetical protein